MGKFYSYFFFLLLPFFASAQLYIKSFTGGADAYLYNKGEIVYVTKDIGMDGNPNQTGGNLYLRNEGQLIQGSDTSENSGTGVVSVFQENTRDAWDYHMWASPVGDPSLTENGNASFYLDANGGGGVYERQNNLESSIAGFTNSYDGVISPLTISNTWLYKYVATSGYLGANFGWVKINNSNPLKVGEGFSMKGFGAATDSGPTGGTPLDFRGRPNNGLIQVDVKPEQRTLVGNPYPSAMNLSFFLLYNSGQKIDNCYGTYTTPLSTGTHTITGEAYFWESDSNVQSHYLADYLGGYGTFTPAMDCTSEGIYTAPTYIMYNEDGTEREGGPSINTDTIGNEIERKISPIGQGFFILGRNLTDEEIKNGITDTLFKASFINEFRVFEKESDTTYKPLFKSKNEKSKTSISVSKSPTNLRAGGLTYNENGFLVMPKFTLSTVVNKKYVRTLTGLMYENATLGFDPAGDGKNRSALSSDINFKLENETFPYLINIFPYNLENRLGLSVEGEKENNTFAIKVTDLNFITDDGIWLHDKVTDEYHDILDNSYEFTLPKGVYPDRYEITFKDFNAATLEVVEEVKKSFAVYQNNSRAELTVLNPLETELKEISVFDITGRLLASKINEGTNNKVVISSSNWSDGIYIVKVITRDNVEFSKKVSVINMK
ncbi:T9SS sorting signal type C domain-containing protein [Leeuwenhoekiella sp. LLG6367-2.1]|uniref:T9SS sorting signal type C domain-containing protein n=1 Tax=Leeuwenhoekiella sp. LLG6367-2.1 TaxID=3160833 RepID=UPI003865EA35